MSEDAPKKNNRLKKGAAAVALVAAGAAGGLTAQEVVQHAVPAATYMVEGGESVSSPARAAEQNVANDIALEHQLRVAEGVTAVVGFEDGSRVNIKNPIIERIHEPGNDDQDSWITVPLERTRGEDQGEGVPATGYYIGQDGVTSIFYHDVEHEDGTENLDFGQHGQVDSMSLVRSDNLSATEGELQGNFFVVPPADSHNESTAPFTGLRVGEGTLHTSN
jgi:hypothetical protein